MPPLHSTYEGQAGRVAHLLALHSFPLSIIGRTTVTGGSLQGAPSLVCCTLAVLPPHTHVIDLDHFSGHGRKHGGGLVTDKGG